MTRSVRRGVYLAVALTIAGVLVAAPVVGAGGSTTTSASSSSCSGERWAVKTLTDARAGSVGVTPVSTTVRHLRGLPAPALSRRSPRLRGVETTTYRIGVLLRFVRAEDDGDIHLVAADPKTGGTMIVEFPSSVCTVRSRLRRRIDAARRAVEAACGPISGRGRKARGHGVVTGVGCFDFIHGQRGVAPNGIELHPVTGFRGACA